MAKRHLSPVWILGDDVTSLSADTGILLVGDSPSTQHLAIDGEGIQSKLNGTTVAPLELNPLGGVVNVGVGGLETTGVVWAHAGIAVSAPFLGGLSIFEADMSTYLAVFHSHSTGVLIRNYEEGKPIKLFGESGGSQVEMANFDPEDGTEIFDLLTASAGLTSTGTTLLYGAQTIIGDPTHPSRLQIRSDNGRIISLIDTSVHIPRIKSGSSTGSPILIQSGSYTTSGTPSRATVTYHQAFTATPVFLVCDVVSTNHHIMTTVESNGSTSATLEVWNMATGAASDTARTGYWIAIGRVADGTF